jgi:hypothetical protein
VSQDITNSPVNGARWADGPSPSDSDDRSGPGVVGGAVYSHDCFGFSDASQRVARVVVSQIVYVQQLHSLRPFRPLRPASMFSCDQARRPCSEPSSHRAIEPSIHLGTDHAHNRRPTRIPARRALLSGPVGAASSRHWLAGSSSLGGTRRSDDHPQNGRLRRYVSTSLALCTLPWPDPCSDGLTEIACWTPWYSIRYPVRNTWHWRTR